MEYVLVIDCGSSSTRISAFHALPSGSILPHLEPLSPAAGSRHQSSLSNGLLTDRVQTMPGVANAFLLDRRHGVRQSLWPLLEWARSAIPRSKHKHTALLLCATAGVRSMSESEQQV
jgi:Golgi nucleoside diphosphatase